MTGRELIDSFDWGALQTEVGDAIDINMYPPASRVGTTLVDFTMQARPRVRFNLDSDHAIASATLPLSVMRRRLLAAASGVPLAALEVSAAQYTKLVDAADKRGDVAGADAWRTVVEAIDVAKAAAAKAVAQQTWDVDE